MRTSSWRFNIYLLAALLMAGGGCQSSKSGKAPVTMVQLFIEASPYGSERTQTISVGRTSPVKLTVTQDSFLDGRYLEAAEVVETMGGFALDLQFDAHGKWMMESVTSLNAGRRVAVLVNFPKPRWLAAPLPPRRIADGRLIFTPDCTREEADQIVAGLKRTNKLVEKVNSKPR